MRRRAPLAAALGLAAAAACAPAVGGSGEGPSEGALRPVERVVVGDARLAARAGELAKSKKARRAAAWQAVARALAPVAAAEGAIKETLPTFRTWYGKDDVERVFAKAYGDLGPDGRKARAPIKGEAADAAFAWNAKDKGSWSEDDYLARVRAVTDADSAQGLAGNARVGYSPGFVRHLLGTYAGMLDCLPKLGPGFEGSCFSSELPADAALVKASWWRADFGMKLPVRPTDAATLGARLEGRLDQGGWGKGEEQADPDARHVYTIKTSDGSAFRLAGIHLATKELHDWLWVSLWWSPNPDEDFGADRPREIRELGGPWDQYKMCVVTAYEEGDPDPRGGFEGSLGDALAAVHGDATWCSNPYIERGARNAQTNCIGCHQHAGDPAASSEAVLADPARFPKSGRTKVRATFPFDYVFQLDARPDQLARAVEQHVTSWRD